MLIKHSSITWHACLLLQAGSCQHPANRLLHCPPTRDPPACYWMLMVDACLQAPTAMRFCLCTTLLLVCGVLIAAAAEKPQGAGTFEMGTGKAAVASVCALLCHTLLIMHLIVCLHDIMRMSSKRGANLLLVLLSFRPSSWPLLSVPRPLSGCDCSMVDPLWFQTTQQLEL